MATPNMAPAAGPQDQAQKQGDQGVKPGDTKAPAAPAAAPIVTPAPKS